MIQAALLWALLASSPALHASETVRFPKDCAKYAARYAQLLQDRADRDVAAASGVPDVTGASSPAAALLRVERARERAAAAAEPVEGEVARSCRLANRSQYECVMQAERYEDLPNCGLASLPVLGPAERQRLPPPPPPTPAERAQARETLTREWVSRGVFDLDALGTGSGSSEVPPPPPPPAAREGE